jgi:hypothetical protein
MKLKYTKDASKYGYKIFNNLKSAGYNGNYKVKSMLD